MPSCATSGPRITPTGTVGRRARHAYLGVELSPLTPETRRLVADDLGADATDLPDRGALVVTVVPRSPAHAAGLKKYDVVTRVGDDDVRDVASVLVAVEDADVGDTLPLRVFRPGPPGKRLGLDVTAGDLGDFTDPPDAPSPPPKKPVPAFFRD